MSKTPAKRPPSRAARAQPNPPPQPVKTDWFALVLEHHAQIRSAFDRALAAPPGGARLAALKGLAVLLTGHSIAEEAVLYPVLKTMGLADGKEAYSEQSDAKVEMAALEMIDPASGDWEVRLDQIRSAVLEHMAAEENDRFPAIREADVNQAKLTARYAEEFGRYTGTGYGATNAAWGGPPRVVTG